MNYSFNKVLQLSDQEEKRRIDRPLDDLMEDEYKLNTNMKKLIEDQQYIFPSLNQSHTTPDILIRTQDTISAKKHHYTTAPYFHRHDFIELVYVYKGLCYQYLESEEELLILKEGDLFILNQNVLHALYQPHQDDVIIKIIVPSKYLGFEFAERQMFNESIFKFLCKSAVIEQHHAYHYLHFHTLSNPSIRVFVEAMVTEYYQKGAYFEDAICYYLKLLFIELSRHNSIVNSVHFDLKATRLQRDLLLNYVRDNMQTITLEQLAQEFSYNRCYLSRLIAEEFGENFQKIVRDIRLEKIETLITYSDLSIEEIAQQVGYKKPTMVYKIMRDKYDMTPAEYRKSNHDQSKA